MKSKFVAFFISIALMFSILLGGTSAYAEGLVNDIKFDEATRTLTIKTNPDADIFLSNLAGRYYADSEGNFSITIPADLDRETVLINDYINNASTEFDYDFAKKTVATDPVNTPSSTTDASKTNTGTDKSSSGADDSETPAANSSQGATSTSDPAKQKKESNAKYFWILLVVLLVIILIIFAVTRKGKSKGKHSKH